VDRGIGYSEGPSMNLIGKIFVFAVFIMSLVLMTFATAIFMSHTNWQKRVQDPSEGLEYLLSEANKEKDRLTKEITALKKETTDSEAARDQVVAKLQTALGEKSGEVDALRKEKVARQDEVQLLTAKLQTAQESLAERTQEVGRLRTATIEQEKVVREQVERARQLAADLAEQKSQFVVANERKTQLEKQVSNARLLLQQTGLSIDSPPRERVPKLDGAVLAVADNAIEVSIGSDDGLQVGHTLEVYRGDQYVGRAVVRAVRADHAIAEPVPEFMRGIVQRGDKVTTKLKA